MHFGSSQQKPDGRNIGYMYQPCFKIFRYAVPKLHCFSISTNISGALHLLILSYRYFERMSLLVKHGIVNGSMNSLVINDEAASKVRSAEKFVDHLFRCNIRYGVPEYRSDKIKDSPQNIILYPPKY